MHRAPGSLVFLWPRLAKTSTILNVKRPYIKLDDMKRRTLLSGGTLVVAVLAVMLALLVFKVRIAVAGGKYVVMLLIIIGVVLLINRALRR